MPTPSATIDALFALALRASNKKIGAELGVDTFPTLLMVCGDKITTYEGELKADPLETFLNGYSKKRN